MAVQKVIRKGEYTSPKYFLIGGAPKSATTSLFHVLSEHPQICPSARKETYFFARQFDYKRVCTVDDSKAGFDSYFDYCKDNTKVRMEGTPYTLYADGAALKIKQILQNVKVLFILRDPIDRLISDFAFHYQQEHPTGKMDFEQYVLDSLHEEKTRINLLSLGLYSNYLDPFFEQIGSDNISIMFYELFLSQPATELQKLCTFLGIDQFFQDGYKPAYRNQTMNVRYKSLNHISLQFQPLINRMRERLVNNYFANRLFERMIHFGRSAYNKMNDRGPTEKRILSAELYDQLLSYYQSSNDKLARELDCVPPWKSFVKSI